jgi:hypothetical protein
MCVSCGCGQVNDDHGDQRNITLNDVQAAAQAANIDVQTAARNIQQGISQGMSGMSGQQPQMGSLQGISQGYGSQPGMGQGYGSQQDYSSQPGMGQDYGSQEGMGGHPGMGPGYGSQGDYSQTDQQQSYGSQQTDY